MQRMAIKSDVSYSRESHDELFLPVVCKESGVVREQCIFVNSPSTANYGNEVK